MVEIEEMKDDEAVSDSNEKVDPDKENQDEKP